MQSVMAGQAAVGVLVSAAQLLSTAGSLRVAPAPPATPPSVPAPDQLLPRVANDDKDSAAQARAAFWFFALSTVFLLATAGAHAWLIRLPAYRAVADPHHMHHASSHAPESPMDVPHERATLVTPDPSGEKRRIMRVFRANLIVEAAVAYVFVVTLVSTWNSSLCGTVDADRYDVRRPCFRRSRSPFGLLATRQIH
jgi:solute carrier family 29 (equilibrative nucleoside transporter), member 1/2/3